MMQKTIFDVTKHMQYLSADDYFGQGIEICASNAYDAVYSIAIKYAKNKTAQIVCREKDFNLVGATITKALKDANANFTTLLVDGVEYNSEKANSSFNFDGGYVLAVGDENTLSLALAYASKHGVDCHALLTEPCFENAFSSVVKVPTANALLKVKVKPFKTVIYDFEVIKKASNTAFSTAYVCIMSNLLSLIDYKMRLMLTGEDIDEVNYNKLKNTVETVMNLASFKNGKDVLIYASAVLSLIRAKSQNFTDFAVELYSDALLLSPIKQDKGDRILTALLKLAPLYKMFFSNDFSSILSSPNYLGDVYELESLSGVFAGKLIQNVKVPTKKRLELILQMLEKSKATFLKEASVVLSLSSSIEKVYLSILKGEHSFEFLPYSELKRALKLCTYLSNKQSVLTVYRDLGVINCVNL